MADEWVKMMFHYQWDHTIDQTYSGRQIITWYPAGEALARALTIPESPVAHATVAAPTE